MSSAAWSGSSKSARQLEHLLADLDPRRTDHALEHQRHAVFAPGGRGPGQAEVRGQNKLQRL